MTVMRAEDTDDVRRYAPADATACCELINAAVADMDGLNDAARAFVRAKNTPEELHRELRSWYTLVVERDGRCVAIGALDAASIKRVYVDPYCQGAGVGEILMQALENEAQRRGHRRVSLEASPSSVPFYERRGYVVLGDERLVIGAAVFEYTAMQLTL
jgi:ribosomal protein S18 acetylase RimI-like enzyme